MEQLYAEILGAGNNPDALRQIAIRYGLDPSFVASVASGTGRTTMAQSFDPSLLVAAGIISPDVLSQGLAGAGEAAYQDALRGWMADAQKFQGTAPQLNSVIDYTYSNRYGGDNPIMNLFNDIRNGKSADQVIAEAESPIGDTSTSYKQQLTEGGFFPESDWLTLKSDLKDFEREVSNFRQDEYEFMLKSDPNSPQYQAGMASLGAMPTRETFDTSQARLDYAKALGMPALALLPDPAQGAYVTQEEFEGALGGRDRFKALQDYITTFDERALRPVEEPVGGRIQGYGADRRAGGIGEGRGMTPEEIRQIDIQVADKKNARLNAGLMKLEKELLAGKPNPFQEALKQFNIFGALEANV